MKPDPKLFQQKGKKRASRPMAMRWGSANVLTLHEGVGLAADRGRLDLEAQFNASGIASSGCKRQDADVKEIGEDAINIGLARLQAILVRADASSSQSGH